MSDQDDIEDNQDNPVNITKLETKKSNLPQTMYMNLEIINKFPSLTLCVGKSGSGKSNVVANMLTKKEFMKGFFDQIYLFSPTANSDDLVEHLKLKKENIIEKLDQSAIVKLNKIVDDNTQKIKSNGIA